MRARVAALFATVLALALAGCQKRPEQAERTPSTIHLTALLERAEVASGGPPPAARETRRWSFAAPLPEWRLLSSATMEGLGAVASSQQADALRLAMNQPGPMRVGGMGAAVGRLDFADWETVIVKARTNDRFAGVTVLPDVAGADDLPGPGMFFMSPDRAPPLFNDGSVQSYAIPLRPRGDGGGASFESLAVLFAAPGPAEVDVLEVALVPRGAGFLDDSGVKQVSRDGVTRQTLFAHAPATIRFKGAARGAGARLDVGLAVNRGEKVAYTVAVEGAGARRVLFAETLDEPGAWRQVSVALENPGNGPADLVLEAKSDRAGDVALFGAPVVSTPGASELPNVIFYVIDGGDANLMSLYEYGRPTTPFLEELAREGVLFTRAHSNATWTQPSTASFMTSLHHSVLGGLRRGIHSTALPPQATTMAEHFRRAGYMTFSLTANPNAGRIIGTDRGMDLMRDVETDNHSTSSIELFERFLGLREAYPAEPYFVHFQTTDVHEPNHPVAPFKGRFTTAEQLERLEESNRQIWANAWSLFGTTSIAGFYDAAIERAGIDRKEFFSGRRDLYDETMLHQDHALEQVVARLKESGEWQRTLLVIGSDHGHPAGTFARFGRGLFDPQPAPWQGAMCDAYATRVPLLVVWPGTLAGGRRIDEPVAMIDVLPTLLDLAGLAPPEVTQGQSLAPLLRGATQELRPVVLDEFRVDTASGELVGNIEIIDGRFGASLEIGPVAPGADASRGRHAVPAGGRWGAVHPYFPEVPRLLLYDLEKDPFTLTAVNDEHPDLVARYTRRLLDLWAAHRLLARQFEGDADVTMTPEQLEQLKALGYIR